MKNASPHAQRGVVLIIALLFLTILTILGITAMSGTTFEERMAGNARDRGIAFQAAEAALRDARRDLSSIVVPGFTAQRVPPISKNIGFGDGTDTDGTCGANLNPAQPQTLGLCRPLAYVPNKGIPPPVLDIKAMPSVEYGKFTGVPKLVGVSQQPQYIIEVLCLPKYGETIGPFCAFYRITARGFGNNSNTVVTLQEFFLKI